MNGSIQRLNERIETLLDRPAPAERTAKLVRMRNEWYSSVLFEWIVETGDYLPPIRASRCVGERAILARYSTEAYAAIDLPHISSSDRRPLGAVCLFHPHRRPLAAPEIAFPDAAETHPIRAEPVRAGLLDRLTRRWRRGRWLENNTVSWRGADRVRRGIAPFLARYDRYFVLTCLSLDEDRLCHIRVPLVFGPQTVCVLDGEPCFLRVSIDAFPPTRVAFDTIEFRGDAVAPATDCCVTAMWLAGFVDSPHLSRYINLFHNAGKGKETISASFGDDLVVEAMVLRAVRRPLISRDIILPPNPDRPTEIVLPNADPLFSLYASPFGRTTPCYFSSRMDRTSLYRLFDSLGLNAPNSIALLMINEHALVLTHTSGYECLELQLGYREDAYDYLMVRNLGHAYLYFYLTRDESVSVRGWSREKVLEAFDPFRDHRAPRDWLRCAYDPPGPDDPPTMRAIKTACGLVPRSREERRRAWERVDVPEFRAWRSAEGVEEHYLPEWIEMGGSEAAARRFPHLITDFHLAIRSGIMTRNESIEWYRRFGPRKK